MPNERTVAEMVIHLGRTACRDGDLTAAQWTALRYFSRANRFSRTVSAFAEFHLTTKGTALQTVKSLVSRGLLARTPSDRDGRSVTMELTRAGRAALAALAEDPFEALVNAVARLPRPERDDLETGLTRVLEDLAGKCGKPMFGICSACSFLCKAGPQPQSIFTCRLVGEALEWEETQQICVNFRPRRREEEPSGPASKRKSCEAEP
jgi:DNA-binding MarR family transcriptional regulator